MHWKLMFKHNDDFYFHTYYRLQLFRFRKKKKYSYFILHYFMLGLFVCVILFLIL